MSTEVKYTLVPALTDCPLNHKCSDSDRQRASYYNIIMLLVLSQASNVNAG